MESRKESINRIVTRANSVIRESLVNYIDAAIDQYQDDPDNMPFPDKKYMSAVKVTERLLDDKDSISALERFVDRELRMRFDGTLAERVEIRIEDREKREYEKAHMPKTKPKNQ